MAATLEQLEREVEDLTQKVRSVGRPLTHEERLAVTEQAGAIREQVADHWAARMQERKPEVVSRGKPRAAGAAKRGQLEARARLERVPEFRAACSSCPAAETWREATGGVTVRCGIERSRLSSETSPQSLLTFCFGDYSACTTWRLEKRRLAEGQPSLVAEHEGE